MSLMGIDVGTTGAKVAAFSTEGSMLALAQREYDVIRPQPGWAELDSRDVWSRVQDAIREVAVQTARDPVSAISITCMGEAMTPVSRDGEILGNCLLGFDTRGKETLDRLAALDQSMFFERCGNLPSPPYSGQKLVWLRDNQPQIFDRTHKFLGWGSLVAYMLGSEPVEDYSSANRTLFLDLKKATWSAETLDYVGMPVDKLPPLVQAGTPVGVISVGAAQSLGLPDDVTLVIGAHDQCANALGAGVIHPGMAAFGLGTYVCITPTYDHIPQTAPMIQGRSNVEHHAVAGLYVSFLYNLSGGALLKWFRDTFAVLEQRAARAEHRDVYDLLLAEMPNGPTSLLVLPHFAPTGPPFFDPTANGMITGLTLETSRGEFIKGLLEGIIYYLRDGLTSLSDAGIDISEYRMTGGGARSDAWLQIIADILGKPLARPQVSEAGALGAALLAGLGSGVYQTPTQAVEATIHVDRVFEPDPTRRARYDELFERYQRLYPFSKTIIGPT
jgi:xylulokinase